MGEDEISVLIGGKAGEGINIAGQTIAQILADLGYRVCMYYDNPSRIKGGHNYAIVRGSTKRTASVRDKVDIILALDQETVRQHEGQLKDGGVVIFNADVVRHSKGIGIPIRDILAIEHAPVIMGNSVIIGAFVAAAGIEWTVAEKVIRLSNPKGTEQNILVARRGFDASETRFSLKSREMSSLPVFSGNEATAIGLVEGGIALYIAYPMSPTSNLLHFFAAHEETRVRVIQPESEIAAILMALGAAYAGLRAAVGTSGGGFCLMTEALGFSGIAEIPVLIVLGQRAGPSTGLATYSAQADLQFALNAGQGEFPRLIVAPGDLEEVRFWSRASLDLAWKYQLPAIFLMDRILCEGVFSLDSDEGMKYYIRPDPSEQGDQPYRRYTFTDSGISPMKFPPVKDAVIRVNSHVHDTDGITTEEAEITREMADKRNRKLALLQEETEQMDPVHVGGDRNSSTCLLCWGSNKGICNELGEKLGLRVIQPVVLWPFPLHAFTKAMQGVNRMIPVETNETGQLARLVKEMGYTPDIAILKYDGRPFTVEELENELRRVLA